MRKPETTTRTTVPVARMPSLKPSAFTTAAIPRMKRPKARRTDIISYRSPGCDPIGLVEQLGRERARLARGDQIRRDIIRVLVPERRRVLARRLLAPPVDLLPELRSNQVALDLGSKVGSAGA